MMDVEAILDLGVGGSDSSFDSVGTVMQDSLWRASVARVVSPLACAGGWTGRRMPSNCTLARSTQATDDGGGLLRGGNANFGNLIAETLGLMLKTG